MMKTDIQIAQEAELMHIKDVAASIGISEEELEFYGKYKAKLSDELWENVKDRKDGKLVLVTAINPTPAGEGKTTITVGLGEAFAKMNKKAIIALREPSLGPCFGIKGGAAGYQPWLRKQPCPGREQRCRPWGWASGHGGPGPYRDGQRGPSCRGWSRRRQSP